MQYVKIIEKFCNLFAHQNFSRIYGEKIVRTIYVSSKMVVSQLIWRIDEGKTMKIIETFCSFLAL